MTGQVYTLADFGVVAPDPAPDAPKDKPRDSSQSGKLFRKIYAAINADAELSDDDLIGMFKEHPHVKDKSNADRDRAIKRCADKARTHTEKVKTRVLAEMNAKHAIVLWGDRTVILTEKTDPLYNRKTFGIGGKHDLFDWYIDQPFIGAKDRGRWWFQHRERRKYLGIVFSPAGDIDGFYNMWKGYSVTPDKDGDCPLFKAFVKDVIASGNSEHEQYIWGWCADLIQRPTTKPGIILVLRGGSGVGKNTLANAVGSLIPNHYVPVAHPRHLVGNFNAHQADALLVFSDEATFAGDKAAEGILKNKATENTMLIERKGRDAIPAQNNIHIIMASNKDWVAMLEADDRRFAVFDVADTHKQDSQYFAALHHELDNGGREALLHHLQSFDLSAVNLRAIPATQARLEQIRKSLDQISKWWFGRLWSGAPTRELDHWPAVVPGCDLYADYMEEAKLVGYSYRAVETEVGSALHKLIGPGALGETRILKSGKRVRAYKLPTLDECRSAFLTVKSEMRGVVWPTENGADTYDREAM